MSLPTKRKHVMFDGAEAEAEAGPSSAIHPDRAHFHPDRAAAIESAQPAAKKPKVKSSKKKQYLAKKARRQRKLKSAKKAAAPKNKEWTGEGEESDDDDSEAEDESGDEEGETEEMSGQPEVPSTSGPVDDATAEAAAEADERAKRKAEKRAIRDARKGDRKAKRAAERAAKAAPKPNGEATSSAPAPAPAASDDEDEAEDEEQDDVEEYEHPEIELDTDADAVPDLPTRLTGSPSPPPLEPFPLPRMAAAPDAAVLSRQGMPTGLEDATFIDQGLRQGVAALAETLGSGTAGLSERTQKRLAELGVDEFFAVQAAILPHLLSLPLVPLPHAQLSDYLISAPTGSGKTLAYAVPIVEVLRQRVVPRLRALIVLPTRDLVLQVRETLEALAKGTGLLIGSVTGQHSFAHEQAQLVGSLDEQLLGGSSKLDILIATPGRLMDHLASTPNFTLQHLRFLVIDEADRLLTQSFQNWLAQVLAHARPPSAEADRKASTHDAVASSWAEPLGLASGEWEGSDPVQSTCQKLLFSATLTRDPAKVAALDLSSPQYYIVQSTSNPLSATAVGSSFALPSELTERMLILPPALKPLNLIHLLHAPQFNATPALVFTKSVEAATRLVKLLEFFEDAFIGGNKRVTVRGYTRDMAPAERKRLLKDFSDGKVDVIVCSDLVARGMDLPQVAHVISYDTPLDMTKYVHRAGRTARAGREGTAWTLVEKQEALHFKGMLKGAGHEAAVKKVKVKEDELDGYKESYEIAMKRLREVYGRD
ncbi:ATP-dependent RNA helicase dbp6 [Vanrija albida]|uniref:ATP-dependent RNA helicase n=1 Tax=Vanrija albida TaxID=181172 RepID=A0ABR3QCM4_9TREE